MFEPDIEIEYDDRTSRVVLINDGFHFPEHVRVQFSSEGKILSEYTLEHTLNHPINLSTPVIIDVPNPFEDHFQGSVRVTYKNRCICQLFVKNPPEDKKGYLALDSYSRHCSSWIRRILCNGKPPIGRNEKQKKR